VDADSLDLPSEALIDHVWPTELDPGQSGAIFEIDDSDARHIHACNPEQWDQGDKSILVEWPEIVIATI
jgi:hypothetical protein